MANTKLSVEQRIQQAHFWLIRAPKWVAYTGIIMLGKVDVVNEPITACTDGWNVKYGREFMSELSDEEIRAIVVHENLHKMFRHLVTWRKLWKISPLKANMACDYVINLMIADAKDPAVKLPQSALLDEKFRGMDAGRVFNLLPDDPGGYGNGWSDIHDWENAVAGSKEEETRRRAEVDSAIRQGAVLAGRMNGNVPREFGELMTVKVDYRTVLSEFVNAYCKGDDMRSFRKPNRRHLDYELVMPVLISESIDHIVVGCDTSGSIYGPVLNEFISNIIGILSQTQVKRLDVLYWDTEVAGHETYFNGDMDKLRTNTKPKGGGGTDAACVPKYMRDHDMNPTCVVMLSDGYVSRWGDWDWPLLWVLNTDIKPPVGGYVRI